MATGLETKLRTILNEKETKIIPENIKAGVSIFNIEGSAPTIFKTIEAMNASTDFAENTFAIVYGSSYLGTYKLDNGVWTNLSIPAEEVQIMNALNSVLGDTDEYEGLGGTEEEIETVLNTILTSATV